MQLFHLAQDPGEQNNLLQQEPQKVRSLLRLLQNYVDQGRSTPGPSLPNDRKISIRAL